MSCPRPPVSHKTSAYPATRTALSVISERTHLTKSLSSTRRKAAGSAQVCTTGSVRQAPFAAGLNPNYPPNPMEAKMKLRNWLRFVKRGCAAQWPPTLAARRPALHRPSPIRGKAAAPPVHFPPTRRFSTLQLRYIIACYMQSLSVRMCSFERRPKSLP